MAIECFQHYDYSDHYYNAIVTYLMSGKEVNNLPFVNGCHKYAFWKCIKEECAYSLDGDQNRLLLYFTNPKTETKYLVIPKSQIQQYLTDLYYNLEQGFRGRDDMFNKINATTVGIS